MEYENVIGHSENSYQKVKQKHMPEVSAQL